MKNKTQEQLDALKAKEAKQKLFNVVIKNMNGEIVSTIGTNLNERQAERRLETGLSRINTNSYFVDMQEVA